MNKLFLADISLILATLLGGLYVQHLSLYSEELLVFIFLFYVLSKIIGYLILPYDKFEKFINKLSSSSRSGVISGYEIFKGSLVTLLFIASLLLHPGVWIVESLLVVLMRIWGKMYFSNLQNS